MTACGCARCYGERNCAFCRTWNWERELVSEPVESEVILAGQGGWQAHKRLLVVAGG